MVFIPWEHSCLLSNEGRENKLESQVRNAAVILDAAAEESGDIMGNGPALKPDTEAQAQPQLLISFVTWGWLLKVLFLIYKNAY